MTTKMSPNMLSKLSWAAKKSVSCCIYLYIRSVGMHQGAVGEEDWRGGG
jgi:hypothetical protein